MRTNFVVVLVIHCQLKQKQEEIRETETISKDILNVTQAEHRLSLRNSQNDELD